MQDNFPGQEGGKWVDWRWEGKFQVRKTLQVDESRFHTLLVKFSQRCFITVYACCLKQTEVQVVILFYM